MKPKLTVICGPRSARLTEFGCRRCQEAAEEALDALKQYGPGGLSVIRQALVDCLAACSVCELWEHEEKGFFATALKEDLALMYVKLENMEKNWNWGDEEVSRIRKKEYRAEWEKGEGRQAWLEKWKEEKKN